MKKLIYITSLILGMITFGSYAQNYTADALKFSQRTNDGGTSRIHGIGGNHSAIGADLSNIAGNPAGIGMYSKNDFGISFNNQANQTKSTYLFNNSTENYNQGNISNLGIVFGKRNNNARNGWKTGNFGISYSLDNSLRNKFSFSGQNNVSSIVDSFVEFTNKFDDNTPEELDSPQNFDQTRRTATRPEVMYYQTYLIEPGATTSGLPYRTFDWQNPSPVRQTGVFDAFGKSSSWNFAYGAGYQDKLYLGASASFTNSTYNYNYSFTEDFIGGTILNSMTHTQNFETTASGIKASIGFIYKPINAIRIGGTIHTPTSYIVSETFVESIAVSVNPTNKVGIPANLGAVETLPNDFDYEIKSPLRASGGMAFFLGKKGFITADAEYVNYRGINISSSYLSEADNRIFRNKNDSYVDSDFQNVVNLKLGAEVRIANISFRGGAQYLPSAYKVNDGINRDRTVLSAGAGITGKKLYVDASVARSIINSSYVPYVIANEKDYFSTKNENIQTNFRITLGVKF